MRKPEAKPEANQKQLEATRTNRRQQEQLEPVGSKPEAIETKLIDYQ